MPATKVQRQFGIGPVVAAGPVLAAVGLALLSAGCAPSDVDVEPSAATEASAAPARQVGDVTAPQVTPAAAPLTASPSPGTSVLGSQRRAPPSLPFTFVGSWSTNGKVVAYVQRNGHILTLSTPGPIDTDYEVVAVDEQHAVFNYRPLGVQQRLALRVPVAARGTVGSDGHQPVASRSTRVAAPARPARLDSEDAPAEN